MCIEYTEEFAAAVPGLVVVDCWGEIVGGMRSKQLEATYECSTSDAYVMLRQWALGRKMRRQQL
jgi:hypothetical protein